MGSDNIQALRDELRDLAAFLTRSPPRPPSPPSILSVASEPYQPPRIQLHNSPLPRPVVVSESAAPSSPPLPPLTMSLSPPPPSLSPTPSPSPSPAVSLSSTPSPLDKISDGCVNANGLDIQFGDVEFPWQDTVDPFVVVVHVAVVSELLHI